MDSVTDVTLMTMEKSRFIKPVTMQYKQNGLQKRWDAVISHDAVAILIHNITRDVFVFVKQFRPAVLLANAKRLGKYKEGDTCIDTNAIPGKMGITLELCAGIIDTEKPPVETAANEVFEECGYKVPVEKFEKITSCLANVGTAGPKLTQFYVQVTDDMKTGKGGGLKEEGEFIELEEIPVKDSLCFMMDESINKPMFVNSAILWYHYFKDKKTL